MHWISNPAAYIGPCHLLNSFNIIHIYFFTILNSLTSILKAERDLAHRWNSCNQVRPFSRSVGIE